MNRIVRLTFELGLVVALAACAPGAAPATVPPTSAPRPTAAPPTAAATAAPAGLFFVRPQGEAGPLLAYDQASGALRFSLPAGWLSADNKHYLAAKTGADTQLLGYDLATGAEATIAQLSGQWELSGLSATGRWAALTRRPSDSEKQAWTAANDWKSDVQVVDTQTGKTAHQLALAGNFTVDTLSPTGDALFVIQYLPAVKPDHYQVRVVDLTTEALQDGALVDKREPDEVMIGQRWQAVAPKDGSWLFTLYVRTENNTAFIHALNTVDRYTFCFDLPAVDGNTLDQARAYSLALAPDGQALYAANPALGLVAKVDLNDIDVSRVATFSPDPAAQSAVGPINYAVADGQRVYFSGGQSVWAFDAPARTVRGLSTLDTAISGLALSADAARLFVARPDQPPLALDTASGQALGSQ
jgi:hypothetical protein